MLFTKSHSHKYSMLSENTPLYAGGTGTGDMIRRCQEAGLREPKFEMADGFTLTLWRTKDSSVGAKPSGKMSGKIVELIRGNPSITIPELANLLQKTERTIERIFRDLKAQEIIVRIGPAKGGHWQVKESKP
jgi:ATP-dependent DNA helicase RecG